MPSANPTTPGASAPITVCENDDQSCRQEIYTQTKRYFDFWCGACTAELTCDGGPGIESKTWRKIHYVAL